MNILSVKDLTVSYGRVPALENVSLDVEEGQYLCLVGNNGSGKSTLLKAVMGLVPFDKGSISTPLSPDEISYLPQQNPVEKGFPATVKEVVLTGTQKSGKRLCTFYSKEDKELARRAIETMGIEKIASKRVGCLSGGQQQRVMIARSICRNPRLLFLDEPCAGLDAQISAEIYTMLKGFNKRGMTVVMVSHDMEEIGKYADRVVVINQKIEFDGNAEAWHFYHHHRGCHHD
mgnify:FL=1